jgi:hypothetical protein
LGEFLLVKPTTGRQAAAQDFVGEGGGELGRPRLALRVCRACAESRKKGQIRNVHARPYAQERR